LAFATYFRNTRVDFIKSISFVCLMLTVPFQIWAQSVIDGVDDDGVEHERKLQRQLYRQEWRRELHGKYERFFLGGNFTLSGLQTDITFQPSDDIFAVTLHLEQDLRLPERDEFFTANFLGRITPRSSIYATTYGIRRKSSFATDRDYIFLNDTIPAGTSASPYFNTRVFSAGYMFSAVTTPKAFLGFYFNVYMLFLSTGIDSNIRDINANLNLDVPLPNIGFLARFQIRPWLIFNSGAGFFTLRLDNFGGRLYDLNLGFLLRPISWLHFSVSYQEFDIVVDFPRENLDTSVRYNFRGPTIGLMLTY